MRRLSRTVRLGKTPRPSGMAIDAGTRQQLGGPVRRRHPVDGDRARGRAQAAVHDLQQGALAGAVRPEEREHAAAGDAEIDAVEHLNAPVGRVDALDREAGAAVRGHWPDSVAVRPRSHGPGRPPARRGCCRISSGGPAGDDLAEVEHVHGVADPEHQIGVVLDQDDGAALRRQRGQEAAEGGGLALVEAGARLVEQQHLGIGRQGAGQLDQAGRSGRQRRDRRGCLVAHAHALEEVERRLEDVARPEASSPTRTLSAALRVEKSSRRWKVRARPRRARRCVRFRVTSVPASDTDPRSGRCRPVMTLNSVVLPAPFGPMSPVTVPAAARSETSESAATPPKWTLTWSTSRAAARSGGIGHLAFDR